MRRDIDEALQSWPYDPSNGEVVARQIKARDGRTVLQIRVELGLLQLEVEARPDGVRPHSFATYLDYLRHRAKLRTSGPNKSTEPWSMSAEHCAEADREFAQFYHRRVAWMSLERYDRALQDADHSLALMDFVSKHATDAEYVASHERFRGLVLFHRTQALAAIALKNDRADEAIDLIRRGMDQLIEHHQTWSADPEHEDTPNEALVEQLRALEREIRKSFAVEKTLQEQLDEAVADEDYERAARLRDQIKARASR